MIEISDLGASLPVGGVVIGALRTETGEFACREVPVDNFQAAKYAASEHYFIAADLAVAVLTDLAAPTDEPVVFCLDFARREVLTRLQGEFSDVRAGKPSLLLQTKLASALENSLKEGYNCEISAEILLEKPGLAFYKALEWAKGGSPYKCTAVMPEREQFCKTGWSSWDIWADNLWPEAKKLSAAAKEQRQQAWEASRSGSGQPKTTAPAAGKPASAAPAMVPGEWEDKYGDELPFN